MRGYHQMIRDLMRESSKKIYPWALQATLMPKQAPLVSPGGYPGQPLQNPVPLIYDDKNPDYNPHFEDMKEEPYEVLFELDGWQIEHYEGAPSKEVDWISHWCPVFKWRYRVDQWQVMADGMCPECCESIPDSVIGVWKLKNFDNLPNVEDYNSETGNIFPDSNGGTDVPGDSW